MDEDELREPDDDSEEATGSEMEPAAKAELSQLDPDALPPTKLQAAAPSTAARGLAFGSIVVGGVCGGLIGYAFVDLQCDDGCTVWAGLAGVLGALIGAVGVAIVAVLVLRAMDEWETVKDKDPDQHPARRRPS